MKTKAEEENIRHRPWISKLGRIKDLVLPGLYSRAGVDLLSGLTTFGPSQDFLNVLFSVS